MFLKKLMLTINKSKCFQLSHKLYILDDCILYNPFKKLVSTFSTSTFITRKQLKRAIFRHADELQVTTQGQVHRQYACRPIESFHCPAM